MHRQVLTLTLDGITAGDYLAWVRDPEPPALGLGLHRVDVQADPLGDTVEVVLWWNVPAPAPIEATRAAGLPMTADMVAVRESRELAFAA